MPDVGEGSIEDLRTRLEKAERENAMLKAAIRASPAGILIATAPDGGIEMWNSAALGIRGGEAEDLTQIPMSQHPARWLTFHPDGSPYKPEDLPLSRALMNGETVAGADVIIRDADGGQRWVEGYAAPVYDESGALVAGVVVFQDVTARKAAEVELLQLRRMAELSPDVIYLSSPKGRISYLNQAARALYGVASDADLDLDALSLETLYGADYENVLNGAIPAAIEHGHWGGESEIQGVTGERIPVSHVLIAHRGDTGDVAYLSSVMRDLRPLRQLESQLRQSQRLESIGRLAGGVAHDFNNLLTVIQNYAILVGSTMERSDPRRDDLGQVVVAANRAAELCTQLLSFARQQLIKPSTIDLRDVIGEMTKLFRRTLGEDVILDTKLEADLWTVHVDRSQLDQVLLNLVVNARDAMPEGGHLSIEASNATLDEHYCKLHPEVSPGEYVMLSVSDTGTGMSKEVRERVFEPFYTTKEATKGTGLGLATVHGAVHQNGGHIWIYSELGQGTCFKIYWPRNAFSREVSSGVRAEPIRQGNGTVLVVEDEEILRVLTVRLLESGGYRVVAASSGPEAIEVARAHKGEIDLLVTDIVMPKMNGKTLGERLIKDRPKLRILYVSGYTENTIFRRGVLDDDVEFLAKPFGRSQLLERVQTLLNSSARVPRAS